MIPKIIHYCWYGNKEMPELAQKCLKSWEKYCPDYKIIRWDESNTDLESNQYVKEAYEAKKWAFITDYVRLKVLHEYGGVYMDTDVQLIASIDKFLTACKGFSGFENESQVPTGIMAAEKGHHFIEELLKHYDNKHFLGLDGKPDMTTNVRIITDMAEKKGLLLNNQLQIVDDFTFYPFDFFCPKDSRTLRVHITKNTVAIHHFAGSWGNPFSHQFKRFLKIILGEKLGLFISKIKNKRR